MIAGKAQPGKLQGAVEDVMRKFRGGEKFRGFGGDGAGKFAHRFGLILRPGENLRGQASPFKQALAVVIQVALRLVRKSKMREEEPPRVKLRDGVERCGPEFQGNIGRRRGGKNEAVALHADSGGVAD